MNPMPVALVEPALVDTAELARPPAWHVLWTRSHCEALVGDQLAAKGFRVFLPTVEVWSRRAGVRRRIRVPMFPGYVFLHHALDKWSDVEVRKARGLVTILGDSWERRDVVPPAEIEAARRLSDARLPVMSHAYLREGQRVRITRGPLADVEGILVRTKPGKGLLVVSVELLRRSVAVEVDCTLARAV
jgi:transcription antitermination factor NusG